MWETTRVMRGQWLRQNGCAWVADPLVRSKREYRRALIGDSLQYGSSARSAAVGNDRLFSLIVQDTVLRSWAAG